MDKASLRKKLLKKYNSADPSPLTHCQLKLDEATLVPAITNFVAAYPSFSNQLFHLHGSFRPLGSRLGRGEIMTWFLYDDVQLGGSSSSIDVLVDGLPRLEIKCAKAVGGRFNHFMMGMDEVPASLKFFYSLLKLYEKNDKAGKLALPQNFANISKSKLDEIKEVSPAAYKTIEDQYFTDLMASPVGSKLYLFFNIDTALPIFFGNLTRDQLKIERISGGLTRLSFK